MDDYSILMNMLEGEDEAETPVPEAAQASPYQNAKQEMFGQHAALLYDLDRLWQLFEEEAFEKELAEDPPEEAGKEEV